MITQIKASILTFLFFNIFNVYSQIENNQTLKDSTFALGLLLEDSFVSNNIYANCTLNEEKIIYKNSKILIRDARKCTKSYYEDMKNFYEIIYNNKIYFIEKEKVLTNESYFTQLLEMNYEDKTKFKEYSNKIASVIYNDDLSKTIAFIEKCKQKGLIVSDWSFYDESEYTEGTSLKISILNPTQKTIKYIWFTFIGYNAVEDVIIDRLKGSSKITVKGIGPIKSDETGSYNFEYVWNTDLVHTAKISQIKVQYMDGTFKTILNPKDVILDKHLWEILSEQ